VCVSKVRCASSIYRLRGSLRITERTLGMQLKTNHRVQVEGRDERTQSWFGRTHSSAKPFVSPFVSNFAQ
jgi:hypothetical protein